MSKVKSNFERMGDIQTQLAQANTAIVDAIEKGWGENFDDIYFNFIESGYLDSLYDDATDELSSKIFSGGSSLLCGAGAGVSCAFATGALTASGICACIPVAGWIAAAIILAACAVIGIVSLCIDFSTDKIKREAKQIFENLITECATGTQMNYFALLNCNTKNTSMTLSISKILMLIDKFNQDYAKFTAEEVSNAGLDNGVMEGKDGVTLTSINTTITIDGQKYEVSTTEAMNAFYTYESTVMSAEFEASLLEAQGIHVDYNAIVKNANSFMATTVKSKLYTKEFVEVILPASATNYNAAVVSVAETAGLSTDAFKSVLSQVPGALGTYTGLLGGAFLGTLVTPPSKPTDTGGNGGGNGGNGGGNGGGGNGGGGNTGGGGNGGNGGGNGGGGTTPTQPDKTEPEKPSNDVKIPEKNPEKIPDQIPETKPEDIDYDELARLEYEKQGSEAIDKYRQEIVDAVNAKFDSGDLDVIRNKLKEYGYSDNDIEKIIHDRSACINAIVAGDQKQQLAKLAKELAAKNGITDYKSSYDEPYTFEETVDGTASTLLVNMSDNEDITNAWEDVNHAQEVYEERIKETNAAIVNATAASKAIDELMKKYAAQYGTEDTTQWDESAAKEYAEQVEKYNSAMDDLKTANEAQEEAKSKLDQTREAYEKVKKEFLDKVKQENNRTNIFGDVDQPTADEDEEENNGSSDTPASGDTGGSTGENIGSADGGTGIGTVGTDGVASVSDEDIVNALGSMISSDGSSINF